MANLLNETITTVLNLERRLLQLINEATATGYIILEQFAIAQTQAIADAGEASTQEIKRNWNLP